MDEYKDLSPDVICPILARIVISSSITRMPLESFVPVCFVLDCRQQLDAVYPMCRTQRLIMPLPSNEIVYPAMFITIRSC